MRIKYISYMYFDPDKGWKNGKMKVKYNSYLNRKDFRLPLQEKRGENSRYFVG